VHSALVTATPTRPARSLAPFVGLTALLALVIALVAGGRRSERIARRQREEALLTQIAPHPSLSRADRLRLAEGLDATLGPALRSGAMDAEMSRALGSPVRSTSDRRAALASLSARGLTRLSPAQLDEVFAIRLALSERSPAVCVGLWRGRITDGEVMAALARLPPEQALRWFALSREGIRAALAPGFTVADEDHDAVQEVLRRAEAMLSPADRARFARAVDGAEGVSALDGCATMLDVHRAARRVEPGLRERFYRSMARP
jgi:hypothetical protein